MLSLYWGIFGIHTLRFAFASAPPEFNMIGDYNVTGNWTASPTNPHSIVCAPIATHKFRLTACTLIFGQMLRSSDRFERKTWDEDHKEEWDELGCHLRLAYDGLQRRKYVEDYFSLFDITEVRERPNT